MTIPDSFQAILGQTVRTAMHRTLPMALALLLAACGGGGGSDDGTGPPAVQQDPPVTAAEAPAEAAALPEDETLLALVNTARAQARTCGEVAAPAVAAMQLDATVKRAAVVQGDWIRASGVMSHSGPGDSTPSERLTATGYNWSAVGENLARGFNQLDDVVQAWLSSPPHCLNIMSSAYTVVGFHHLAAQGSAVSVTAMVMATPR